MTLRGEEGVVLWRYRLCCCIRALIDIHKQTFHTIASVRPTAAVQVVWEGVTRVSRINRGVVALSQSIGCFIGGMGIEMRGGLH